MGRDQPLRSARSSCTTGGFLTVFKRPNKDGASFDRCGQKPLHGALSTRLNDPRTKRKAIQRKPYKLVGVMPSLPVALGRRLWSQRIPFFSSLASEFYLPFLLLLGSSVTFHPYKDSMFSPSGLIFPNKIASFYMWTSGQLLFGSKQIQVSCTVNLFLGFFPEADLPQRSALVCVSAGKILFF